MEDVQEYLKNRLKELKRQWKVDREKAKNQW